MFSLTIALGPVQWRLLYKSDETLKAAEFPLLVEAHSNDWVTLGDDFGQVVRIARSAITGVLVEDMQQSKLAQQELLLYGERVRHAAMMAAQSDPQLRQHPAPRGPAVLTPMGMNGIPR